jgi:hypothetical protein
MNIARAVRTVQTEAGAVLQNVENDATFSTNRVGAAIWQHLTNGLNQDEVVDRVSSEFGVAREQVCGDLVEFLEKLQQTGLLEKDIKEGQQPIHQGT